MANINKVDDDLRSLGNFKDTMMNILFNFEDVRRLTMPRLDDDRFDESDNFFGGALEWTNPTDGLIERVNLSGHCFDVPYIDETIIDNRALITLESYVTRIEGEHIKEVALDIFAFSNKSFIHMPVSEKAFYIKKGYSGNRVDMMISAIELAIKQRSREFGIGKIMLAPRNPVVPYEPQKDFYGKKITFLCSDFFIKPRNKR